jgi:site-specific recombinase XerC
MDIHNYKRSFERIVERIKESENISEENKNTMLSFKDYLLSENIGTAKIERYLFDLMKYSKMLNKSFESASKIDIRRIVGEINQGNLAEETKKGFKIMLRKLYRFIEGIEEKGKYPERVAWVSIKIQENHKKLPEELLTEEEIKSIIEKCNNLRDRALMSVLSESGCRISEIGTLKVKHISFEEYGARLTVNGKTGMRKIFGIKKVIKSTKRKMNKKQKIKFFDWISYLFFAGFVLSLLLVTPVISEKISNVFFLITFFLLISCMFILFFSMIYKSVESKDWAYFIIMLLLPFSSIIYYWAFERNRLLGNIKEWECEYCGKEFKTKKETENHENLCKKKQGKKK